MNRVCSVGVIAILSAVMPMQEPDNMKAFPPADKGMTRHVLKLPKQDDESAFKIELIAGKTVQVDQVNRHFFGGKIEEQIIEGWGFPRYNVSQLGPLAGTLMAAEPDSPKVDRFVSLGGDPFLIRYNSQLPVVVYAPEGVEIRYRVWSAGAETTVIKKG